MGKFKFGVTILGVYDHKSLRHFERYAEIGYATEVFRRLDVREVRNGTFPTEIEFFPWTNMNLRVRSTDLIRCK